MRRSVVLGLMLSVALFAAAQETPKLEVFAGYELFRVSPSSRANVFITPISMFSTSGGLGSVQFNVNSYVGLVGEFGATRSGTFDIGNTTVALDQTQFLYVFGPRVFVHATSRIVPFMEFLAGGVHNSRTFAVPNGRIDPTMVMPPGVSADVGADTTRFHTTQNALAASIGAGVDVSVTRTIAVRPFQLDYVGTHLPPVAVPGVPGGINDSHWQMNWKYSAGVNFRFGGKRRQVSLTE
jgi:hypothetical protein